MTLVEKIKAADRTLFSFEVLPPLKGKGIESLSDAIDPLMEFKPSFVDVTYHREEYVLRERPDGSFDKISIRKRPGTVAICAAIMNRYEVDAVPHLICGGFTKDETENALIDLNFLGIRNVLALRGDNAAGERNFKPEQNGNMNALDLIYQIGNMNSGIYLDEELKNPNPTDFCVGAAAYPEKHIDAPNMEVDLNFLKRKVDAGASFLTTQMFFDNQKYFHFVENCRRIGINVPIIPGLKPITTKNQIYTLPKIFNIDIPNDLFTEIDNAKDDETAKRVGIEWCIMQSKELIRQNVPVIHFYTMSKSQSTYEVAREVF